MTYLVNIYSTAQASLGGFANPVNSKPFYRHLNQTGYTSKRVKLCREDASISDDPAECATILNNFFHSQFSSSYQLQNQPSQTDCYTGPEILA